MSNPLVDVTSGKSGKSGKRRQAKRVVDPETFGSQLRRLRAAQKPAMSQAKLAEEIGASRSLVNLLEAGIRQPTLDILDRITRALRVSAEQESDLYKAAGMQRRYVESGFEALLDATVNSDPDDIYLRHFARDDLASYAEAWRHLAKAFTAMRHDDPGNAELDFVALSGQRDLTPTLRLFSLRLLAEARRMQGDLPGARDAVMRAYDLRETLPAEIAAKIDVSTQESLFKLINKRDKRDKEDKAELKEGPEDRERILKEGQEGLLAMVAAPRTRALLKAELLSQEGETALRDGQYADALKSFQDSLKEYGPLRDSEEAGAVLHLGMGASNLRLAKVMMYFGNEDRAIEYCDKADEHLDSAGASAQQEDRKRRTREIRAWAYSRKHSFEKARELHDGARLEAQRAGNLIGVMKNWIYLGDDWRRQAEYRIDEFRWTKDNELQIAIPREALKVALEEVEGLDDWINEAELAYDEAIRLIRAGFEDPLTLGLCLRNMAVISRMRGRYAEADARLLQAEQHERKIGLVGRLAAIFEKRADICWDQGLPELATYWYTETLDALVEELSVGGASDHENGTSKNSDQQKRIRAAIEWLNRRERAQKVEARATSPSRTDAIARAQEASAQQAGAVLADPLAQSEVSWQEMTQILRLTALEAIKAKGRQPICVVDTDSMWLQEQLEFELVPGPRLLAQNTPSLSLSADPPPVYVEADRLERTKMRQQLHAKRHKAFLATLMAPQTNPIGDRVTRDLCSRVTVEALVGMDAGLQARLRAALDFSEGFLGAQYQIEAGPALLPLAYCVKGDRVLLEIPWRLAQSAQLPALPLPQAPVDLSSRHYCYRFDDKDLAGALRAIFGALFAVARETSAVGSTSWLTDTLEGSAINLKSHM